MFAGAFALVLYRAAEEPELVQPREETVEHLTAGTHVHGDEPRLFTERRKFRLDIRRT